MKGEITDILQRHLGKMREREPERAANLMVLER
jgi:hypothetical protein